MSGRQHKKIRQLFRRSVRNAIAAKPWYIPRRLWETIVFKMTLTKENQHVNV